MLYRFKMQNHWTNAKGSKWACKIKKHTRVSFGFKVLVGLVTLGLAMPVSGFGTTRLHSLLVELIPSLLAVLSLSLLAGLSQSLVPEPTLLLIFESGGHCSCISLPWDKGKTASLDQCQWLGESMSPRLWTLNLLKKSLRICAALWCCLIFFRFTSFLFLL